MSDPSSPTSRLEGARKQLRLALQQVDDPSVAARIQDARRSARRASDALVSAPITTNPIPEDTTGERLVECSVCGKTGLQERIHSTACPHDGSPASNDAPDSKSPGISTVVTQDGDQ